MLIKEARSWIGTKFKHQGRIKISQTDRGGCDCLGFILGLGIRTKTGGLLSDCDPKIYPRLLNSNLLQEKLDYLLDQKTKIEVGDIILLKINNWPQHLAIVSGIEPHITIIHSYAQAKMVVEQYLPTEWKKNIVGIYRNAKTY